MHEPLTATVTYGQLQIIFNSDLYSFTGKYSLMDDDTAVLSKAGLQFDYLMSIEDHNLVIHARDVMRIGALIEPASLQRYIKFQVRLVTAEGLIKILTAEGKIFDVYKKTAAEWEKSEKDLRSANDLLQTVFDASPHAISVYRILFNRKGDPEDFEILSLNAHTTFAIGMRTDEVVGKRFGKLFPQFKRLGVFDKFWQVAATGIRTDFEIPYEGDDISRWFRFIVVRTGNLIVATTEDVTALKKTESELQRSWAILQSVFDASINSISVLRCVRDEHDRISDFEWLLFNAKVRQFADIDFTGKRYSEIFPGVKESGVLQRLIQVAETGISDDFKAHYQHENIDGWFRNVVVKMEDGLLVTSEDISARHKAEEETVHELRVMNEKLTNLTFFASHDLREPLRKIQFFSDQLAHHEGDRISPKGRELTTKIGTAVQHLNTLIDDILSFFRIATAYRTDHTNINLNSLVKQVLCDLSETIAETHTRIEVGPLIELWGDSVQLAQVLLHLITNAIKFRNTQRTPIVNISGFTLMGSQVHADLANRNIQYFCLEVMDNGIGFDSACADRIFHIFQRLHTQNEYPSTGMGLAICKKIIEQHDGFMIAKGMPGIGSVFHCYFPLKPTSFTSPEPPETTA